MYIIEEIGIDTIHILWYSIYGIRKYGRLGFAHPAETEATCIWKVSLQIVVEISKSLCYECQVRRV